MAGGIGGDLFHAVHLHSVEAYRVSDHAEEWRAVFRLVDQGMEVPPGVSPPKHSSPLHENDNAAFAALCAILIQATKTDR
jgi:hypothetical protein